MYGRVSYPHAQATYKYKYTETGRRVIRLYCPSETENNEFL